MNEVEGDIRSTPRIIELTLQRVVDQGGSLARMLRSYPIQLIGCGSSFGVALVAATACERVTGNPAQPVFASEYTPRTGWAQIAITRTGQTTELLEAMKLARQAAVPVGLLVGEEGSPAELCADAVLRMEFAPEPGVVQTRFITAAVVALHQLSGAGEDSLVHAGLAREVQDGLDQPPMDLMPYERVVFLGRGERYGLARLAALNLQETALQETAAHQTLDYRHGPVAAASQGVLVWAFDDSTGAASAAVLREVKATGASIHTSSLPPLVNLVCAQLAAARRARASGLDPSAPRHLTRAVVL
jgi:glucosamine--fructose-6-phosphate aminotransferase (isomerizing)